MPPSDIELEYGDDEDDHETNSVSLSKYFKKILLFYLIEIKKLTHYLQE
jgi:hypothetical protein